MTIENEEKRKKGHALLRFRYVVVRSFFKMLRMVFQAKKIHKNRDKYDELYRYRHVQKMVTYLRKNAKTTSIVTGEENLPAEGGYIMYANHQGKYDAIGILSYHEKPCSVLIEIEHSHVFSTNEAVDLLDGIRIDQKRPRQQVKCLRQLGEEVRDRGRRFLVFPEGKWGKNKNTLQEFHDGCFYSAMIAKCPIVPVVLIDSWKSMNTNRIFGRVVTEIRYLKAIPYSEYENLSRAELCELVRSRIQSELDRVLSERGNATA